MLATPDGRCTCCGDLTTSGGCTRCNSRRVLCSCGTLLICGCNRTFPKHACGNLVVTPVQVVAGAEVVTISDLVMTATDRVR